MATHPCSFVQHQAALRANPRDAALWGNYLVALCASDLVLSARSMREQALRLGVLPDAQGVENARIDDALRNADHRRERLAAIQKQEATERAAVAREILHSAPCSALAWKTLGRACLDLQDPSTAHEALARAYGIQTEDAEAPLLLAHAERLLGNLTGAEHHYREANARNPTDAIPLAALGNLYSLMGRHTEAEEALASACRLAPDRADIAVDLGHVLLETGREADAAETFRRALSIDPNHEEAMRGAIQVDIECGRLTFAEEKLAARADRADLTARERMQHAQVLTALGEPARASALVEAALSHATDESALLTQGAFLAQYEPGTGAGRAMRMARRFGQNIESTSKAANIAPEAHPFAKAARERLRVGFVSADLCTHPVGYFLDSIWPELASLDVDLIGFPTRPPRAIDDPLEKRLRQTARAWLPIGGLSDADAARAIRNAKIDVLVDLSGFTSGHRLGVFTLKPAPVQLTWLGYFSTTGMTSIDAVIADPVSVPPGAEEEFVERVLRLPDSRLCFALPVDAPPCRPPPCMGANFITFGCTQNLSKINRDVLLTWARILDRCPGSRLVVHNKVLDDPGTAEHFRRRLLEAGVAQDRATLKGRVPRTAYLESYASIDMLLDTFPYPGGTTTCEALFMGVPVVTLRGETMLGRQGASLLTAAGCADWIAASEAEYIAIAEQLAADRAALVDMRRAQRAKVLASPLMDAPRFARNLRDLLWRAWNDKRPS